MCTQTSAHTPNDVMVHCYCFGSYLTCKYFCVQFRMSTMTKISKKNCNCFCCLLFCARRSQIRMNNVHSIGCIVRCANNIVAYALHALLRQRRNIQSQTQQWTYSNGDISVDVNVYIVHDSIRVAMTQVEYGHHIILFYAILYALHWYWMRIVDGHKWNTSSFLCLLYYKNWLRLTNYAY